MSVPTPAAAEQDNGLPVGTRITAGTGESLVPVGTPGTIELAAGEAAIWPGVRYDGRSDVVLTDPRWITPAPLVPAPLALLGAQLYDITKD
uniref:hypothetical protein n=1 Tax=Promicromonospora sp. CA-289581 TaxID=3240013 RepID=UPI003F494551